MNPRRVIYIYILILLPLIYFAIFLHLDSRPFRVWDEAYLGVHTYEMMHDHDYIVTHSFGSPEMSNTKPPFVIWCMTLSAAILGFSELSIRLPNALAGVFVCFIIFFFCSQVLKSSFKGFLSVVVLISSAGFIRLHVIRSGEYDAFLVLFVTLFSLCYFIILENTDKSRWTLLWSVFSISMTCAILTKGVAAGLIVPGLFIYTLIQKKLLYLIRSKELYISVFFIVFFGLGYYLLREHYNPGYLAAVYENELGGRYLKPLISTSPWEYLNEIVYNQFTTWFAFALLGVFAGLYSGNSQSKRFTFFCMLITAIFLVVISAGATRLYWYDAPAFPFLSLLAGSGIYFVISSILKLTSKKANALKIIIISIFIVLLTAPNYSKVISSDLSTEEDFWDADHFALTYYIELKEKHGANLNGYKVVIDWFMIRALTCQVKKWEKTGQKIDIIYNTQGLCKGDKVITNNPSDRQQLDQLYEHECMDTYKNVESWQILGPKKS